MEPLIVNLSADEPIHEMSSICMECFKEGSTRLMLTRIPFFKEIIISSFSCEHCHNYNNSVQPASSYSDKGVRYTLSVINTEDLNRQVIKSEYATIRVPEIELEMPPESQKGSSSTIEGFLTKTRDAILAKQDERREVDPELAIQLDNFINRLQNLLKVEAPFTFSIEDPTGNSFLENPSAPKEDPRLKTEHYIRSVEDEDLLGITAVREQNKENISEEEDTVVTQNEHTEVMSFEAMCNACGKEAVCNMKEVNIPFFKKILLMANICNHCGFKDSEIKSAGGIADNGQKMVLTMTDSEMDLNRDILKSETAEVQIPELELCMTSGSLGGKFTTLEGLLGEIKGQLENINPFSFGDSSDKGSSGTMALVVQGLDDALTKERLTTIILDDPAGNSYIQNVYAPDEDPNMVITDYIRTEEQDDDLGIKDMVVDNYEETS